MMNYLKLRSRVLQSLILIFLGLTCYAYYLTTLDQEIRPSVSTINPSVSLEPRAAALHNSTIESVITNLNVFHNSSNVTISTPLGLQQLSSASISINSSLNNETTQQQQQLTKKSTESNLIIPNLIDDKSARAIYHEGHEVTAAEKCPNSGENMNLVIVIMSAPGHVDARKGIRLTWGHFGIRTDMSIVFLLGTTNDTALEQVLQREEKLYGDIIRGRFIDSYSNLTLKTISMLEWIDTYCPETKFILKTDDDMFINVPQLLKFIKKHEKDKNTIFGRLAKKWKPIRNEKSKYHVSREQFEPPIFPDFTTGPAYLLTSDVIRKLYEAALNRTYLKLEDVFTTGIVAQNISVRRVHAHEFVNTRMAFTPCKLQHSISIHMVKYAEQFDLWKKLLDGKSKCNQ